MIFFCFSVFVFCCFARSLYDCVLPCILNSHKLLLIYSTYANFATVCVPVFSRKISKISLISENVFLTAPLKDLSNNVPESTLIPSSLEKFVPVPIDKSDKFPCLSALLKTQRKTFQFRASIWDFYKFQSGNPGTF